MEYVVLFLGGAILSGIHTLIPNHWVPIISLSRAQKWSRGFTNLAIVIVAFMHSISTIIVGSLLGILGIEIFRQYEFLSRIIPSLIFVLMGIVFIAIHVFDFSKHHYHYDREFHLFHSHIKSIVLLIIVITGFGIGSLYFFISSGVSLGFIILTVALVISVVSVVIVKNSLERKHPFWFYSYHEHNNHRYIHDHSNIHSSSHSHFHQHGERTEENFLSIGKWGAVFSVGIALFFSPCVEIEVYYIQASTLGVGGIVLVSLTYLFITIALTFLLVNIGEQLIEKLKLNTLEHNEDLIAGFILMIFSIVFLFV